LRGQAQFLEKLQNHVEIAWVRGFLADFRTDFAAFSYVALGSTGKFDIQLTHLQVLYDFLENPCLLK
jgi:hypothetical protein